MFSVIWVNLTGIFCFGYRDHKKTTKYTSYQQMSKIPIFLTFTSSLVLLPKPGCSNGVLPHYFLSQSHFKALFYWSDDAVAI